MLLKLIFFILLITVSHGTNDKNNRKKEFIATSEWQIVEQGQHLPAGLHIRHNFETKVTEAKLLDEKEKSHAISVVDTQNNDIEKNEISMDEDDDLKAQQENVAKKYKSYKELKEDLSALNLTIKLDMEVMNELFERFDKFIIDPLHNVDELANILIDFEFFVHQFDNAKHFIQSKGLQRIIFPILEVPNTKLKVLGLHVLSAAVQNNPKVQIAVYERNTIPILIKLLSNENQSIVMPTISTISKLLRRFPTAQWAFIKQKGLENISKLIENDELFIDNNFKLKILTFLIDFVTDSKELIIDSEGRKNIHAEYVSEYLLTSFKSDGWCQVIEKFVSHIHFVNFDVIEQTLILIQTTKDLCWPTFNKHEFRDKIDTLIRYYEKVLRNDQDFDMNRLVDSEYLNHFVDTIRNLTSVIYEKANFIDKDEL
ncbi:nucleotide exchange factor Sil1 [Chrysoperla carnea]|uniref:nucleotide exchange factor Sil1 n=1 Tax=Chrysoperla carnea TaxID=189513 RepID=UPI001D08115E|nr:nucleotide exchange factor Sil1 [Chrysoperla carnea]